MPHVVSLLIADGDDFVSRSLPRLVLTENGIDGDRHAGRLRRADARTPWHKRGTPIVNTRQLSIVSAEDCAEIAALLDVAEIDPALLGANLVIAGIPGLSLALPGSRLQVQSGATIFITEHNAPCRHPAKKIAEALRQPDLEGRFARAAMGRRGVVGTVERIGDIAVGEEIRFIPSPAHVAAPKVPAVGLDRAM